MNQRTTFRAFTSDRLGRYSAHYQRIALALDGLPQEEALSVVNEVLSIHRLDTSDIFNQRYQALLLVLRDLLAQGWIPRYEHNKLELMQPDFTNVKPRSEEEQQQLKRRIQESMSSERLAQLATPSTRRFLQEMEDAPQKRGGWVSVLELFADGPKLAADLEHCLSLPHDLQRVELQKHIRPYLQLIQSEERCKHTGFILMDIWRYMRCLWSLPNYSTPGRNLFYLVRDAARPHHPIIGIAAFSNSIVQITSRDEAIGWTIEALERRLLQAPVANKAATLSLIARTLLNALERGIAGIDRSDLELTDEMYASPTAEAIAYLEDFAQRSAKNRLSLLQEVEVAKGANGSGKLKDGKKNSSVPGEPKNHLDELFRTKRSRALSVLLQARRIFHEYGLSAEDGTALIDLLKTEVGRQAIRSALKTNKQEKVGVNMLDLTTCGSIPPYSHLLGGKLVSLLMTSPEIVSDYRVRYGNSVSEIASRMKGKDVARSAELVWVGTTSLYYVGSSQYNRIKMPAEVCGGEGFIEYKCLGETKGFGTVHYAQDTRQALDKLLVATHHASLINNEFGEGVNPKLRRIRSGMAVVGLDSDVFLRHESRRIVYGIPLAKNAEEFLRGESDTVDYILPIGDTESNQCCTAQIANFWCNRWLISRLSYGPILSRVRATRSSELRVTKDLPGEPDTSPLPRKQLAFNFLENANSPPKGAAMEEPELSVEFIRTLYNNAKSYAEHLSNTQVEAIHVPMQELEELLVLALKSRRSVLLTGNPGDGKTYLINRIRHLVPSDTVVETDATARNLDDIARIWREAITAQPKRPFLLAINEWPLSQILGKPDYRNVLPIREVQEQLRNSIWYSREPTTPPEDVLVVDMNLRNAAQDDIVRKIIVKLTDERIFKSCNRCHGQGECPVLANRRSLINPTVEERLLKLLQKLRQRGLHVTMRDMQGSIAYLLTGGQPCDVIQEAEDSDRYRYFNLLFDPDANNELLAALRSAFDPATITHPEFDELLWMGTLPAEAWRENVRSGELPSQINSLEDALRVFKEKFKRRFYFETQDNYGPKILDMLPPAEQAFEDLLREAQDNPEAAARRLVRMINYFYDPRAPGASDDELRLWTSFRYQTSPAQVYISTSNILSENLYVYLPKLAPWLAKALGKNYLPDHLLLSLEPDRIELAQLLVDINLFRALWDALQGKPVALRPPQTLRRLEAFFGQLRSFSSRRRDSEDVLMCNVVTGDRFAFRLDRRNLRYEKELK